jgi:hypothetical protein
VKTAKRRRGPRPRGLSREWFDRWRAEHPDWLIEGDESRLRSRIAAAEAEMALLDAEWRTPREMSLFRACTLIRRHQKLHYQASCRAGNARERLIMLLRSQGRHGEADALMPPRREGNERQRAEKAREGTASPTRCGDWGSIGPT